MKQVPLLVALSVFAGIPPAQVQQAAGPASMKDRAPVTGGALVLRSQEAFSGVASAIGRDARAAGLEEEPAQGRARRAALNKPGGATDSSDEEEGIQPHASLSAPSAAQKSRPSVPR